MLPKGRTNFQEKNRREKEEGYRRVLKLGRGSAGSPTKADVANSSQASKMSLALIVANGQFWPVALVTRPVGLLAWEAFQCTAFGAQFANGSFSAGPSISTEESRGSGCVGILALKRDSYQPCSAATHRPWPLEGAGRLLSGFPEPAPAAACPGWRPV